jgi:hypothetical protein
VNSESRKISKEAVPVLIRGAAVTEQNNAKPQDRDMNTGLSR